MTKYRVRNDLESVKGTIKAGTIVKGFPVVLVMDGRCFDDIIELEDGRQFLDLNFEKIKKKMKETNENS